MYFPNFIQKWNFQKIFLNFLIQNSQWFIRQFQSHIVEQNYCYHRYILYIFQISSSKNEIFKNLLNFLIQNIQQSIIQSRPQKFFLFRYITYIHIHIFSIYFIQKLKFSENLSNFLIQNPQRFVIRQFQLQKHQLSVSLNKAAIITH